MDQFRSYFRKVSKNNTRTCWVLKCDIRKFFASIDHDVLRRILGSHVGDAKVVALLEDIIGSFQTVGREGKGLPLGNLTSQLLVNVYMNEFDQFVKHKLKQKFYVRYADDFVFLSASRPELEALVPLIEGFLSEKLRLEIHPDKLFIKTYGSGVDFLGWVHFPSHRVLRTATKKRMMRKLRCAPDGDDVNPMVESYLGMLSHGNAHKLQARLLNRALPKSSGG